MNIERLVDRLLTRIIVILAAAILISQFFLSRNKTQVFPNDHPGMLAEPVVAIQKLTCGIRTVTAYSSTVDQCDFSPFITSSGQRVRSGIAASNEFEFGQIVLINGREYEIQDRMSEKYPTRIDIWFPTREEALAWGKQKVQVCW